MKPNLKNVFVFLFFTALLCSSIETFAQPENHQYKTVGQLPAIDNASKIEIQLNPEYVEAAKHENGEVPQNSYLHVKNDTTVVIQVFGWKNFRSDR